MESAIFSPAEEQMAGAFPTIMHLNAMQRRSLGSDPHSLYVGEQFRTGEMLGNQDEAERHCKLMGYNAEETRSVLQGVLFNFFFGNINDPARRWIPMYAGVKADFREQMYRYQQACADIESTYTHLDGFLPETVEVDGRIIRLHDVLRRPNEVMSDDPIELIRLARNIGRTRRDLQIAHLARSKLVLSQFAFEARMDGYAPEVLERLNNEILAMLCRNLFCEREPEIVRLVVTLDPAAHYRCVCTPHFLRAHEEPRLERNQLLLTARRHTMKVPGTNRTISVLFASRSKRDIVLKALKKGTRDLQMLRLGDGVAMSIAADPEDIDAAVSAARPVMARCPGSVCDQGSNIGPRQNGQPVDKTNERSSPLYEVMKILIKVQGRWVELQIQPLISWVNARCMKGPVNHVEYKEDGNNKHVRPFLHPDALFGIPWSNPAVRTQCIDYAHARSIEGIIE